MFARDSVGLLSWNLKPDSYNKPQEFVCHPLVPNTSFPEKSPQRPEIPSRLPPYVPNSNKIPFYDEKIECSGFDLIQEQLK
jgi:hypothetical protein